MSVVVSIMETSTAVGDGGMSRGGRISDLIPGPAMVNVEVFSEVEVGCVGRYQAADAVTLILFITSADPTHRDLQYDFMAVMASLVIPLGGVVYGDDAGMEG